MVVLSKIYTKTGDAGETALGDGSRVAKYALRVDAYGGADETNATVGLMICLILVPIFAVRIWKKTLRLSIRRYG